MRVAYIFQAVNMAVAIILVPLLLHYLQVEGYAVWLIFTAMGGATIQLQTTIQTVMVREVAREYHGGGGGAAMRRTRRAYTFLAAFVAGPYMLAGLAYLYYLKEPPVIMTAWVIYSASFAVVYWLGPNNAQLLATERVAANNTVMIISRVLYLAFVLVFLDMGLSVLGVCLAFAVSTGVGGVLCVRATRRSTLPELPAGEIRPPRGSIGRYGLFTITAFSLYNGAFLIAASIFPKTSIASYGFGLQIATLVTAIALTPVQVWLGRLIRAISSGSRAHLLRELSLTAASTNATFLLGFLGLIVVGPPLLVLLRSNMTLPPFWMLALIFLAFAIELNISVLVNFLMTKGNFSFVPIYAATALIGIVAGVVGARLTGNIQLFVLAPSCIQGLVGLPLILRLVLVELGQKPRSLAGDIA